MIELAHVKTVDVQSSLFEVASMKFENTVPEVVRVRNIPVKRTTVHRTRLLTTSTGSSRANDFSFVPKRLQVCWKLGELYVTQLICLLNFAQSEW